MVRASDVFAALGRPQGELMNFEAFGKRIGIRWPQARRLVLCGLCPARELRNPASGANQLYITEDNLKVFGSTYVTLKLLELETGLSWQRIAKTLRDNKVQKFSLDGRDFGSLYRRCDLPESLRKDG